MQNETVYEEKSGKLTIKVYQDTDARSPEEWGDDELFLVGYHRDFTVRNDRVVTEGQCRAIFTREPDEDEKAIAKELGKQYHIFGLEAYIHSGVVLALSQEGNFPDRQWDVSQLGVVFVAKKGWNTKNKARKAALGLIENWNNALSGNVYGFIVEDEQGKQLDSCWGFSGDYEKSGLLEEAREVAKHHNKPEEREKRAEAYRKADIEEAEKLVKPYGYGVIKTAHRGECNYS